MPTVTFLNHDGSAQEVNVESGTSLMQAAIDNGVEGIVAECGGACSCATCHCYIAEGWMEKVGLPSDLERDMLDCVVKPGPTSRLGCQVSVTEQLDGLVVRVPEAQY
ncbi:2Fe-2S iron-sulfur cluster binding domain-containing protein [Pseudomaricurvus alcaniphilus]|uniref:2Fe-2S iron-sulfur cluster-binding protein n=1 Tax=Pseudomaricurvus alcaniphilus TaxID=1166482 RepID=UPI0014073768|nr:2Fe-2S iron-sulfur cluster-binding protein [Pseudomaricurvus alcaniphilus]NHN39871.1 2Fe-2S iron-sulfur cluster binding domain-containing protein [Pseudomaricurvus alcaniphilus]